MRFLLLALTARRRAQRAEENALLAELLEGDVS